MALSESVAFTVFGPPRPKARARVVVGRGAFTPKRTREYERAIADVGALHCGCAWDRGGAYSVRVVFVFATRKRRDLDNCLKSVLDALNGIAWHDDNQVAMVMCMKRFEPFSPERTEICVYRRKEAA